MTQNEGYILSYEAEEIDALLGQITENAKNIDGHIEDDMAHVTEAEKQAWNSKSDFSGSYKDLSDTPEIPTQTSQLSNDSGFITAVPDEYVTDSELNAKGYLTQHQDISGKADKSDLTSHTGNTTVHITTAERSKWDVAANDVVKHAVNDDIHITTVERTAWNAKSDFSGLYDDLTGKPTIPTKVSELTNDSKFITSIPSEYVTEAELNAKGYLTEHQDLSDYAKKSDIPSVPVTSVNGKTGAVQLSASDVNAEPVNAVSAHNTSAEAHDDIRLAITDVVNRLNALANSTDDELDQMAEVVAYIKANRDLIEQVTTNKINVSDIINNLTTNVNDKPLSAAQGVVLKNLIDALQTAVNGKASSSDLSSHIDNTTAHITAAERSTWNAKSNFSGAYADLTGKPDIPTKTSELTNDSGFLTSIPGEYVTETELAGKGYLTQHQDLSGYAKKTELPTKTSQLTNDSGFLTSHQDISGKADKNDLTSHTGNTTVHITAAERTAWNAKSNFSGSYTDLTNKPTIPTKTSQLTNDSSFTTTSAVTTELNKFGGTIEITAGSPTKDHTLVTINPDGNTASIYESYEIDQMLEDVSDDIETLRSLIGTGGSGGVTTWDELQGKPSTFPPSAHNHDDKYAAKGDIPTKTSQLTDDVGFLRQSDADQFYNNLVYGTCETAAATAEKVVTVSDPNWSLTVGTVVMVYFTTTNSASSVKLNVNNTGAYPIWYNNAEYTSTGTAYTGYAKRVIVYMFNGTHWVWISSSYDANSTYTNVALGQGYATCATAEATTAKVGTLASYTLTLGGIVAVKFTYAVPANATLNINGKGAKNIFFKGSAITANVIKAGDTATFMYDGTQYQLLSVDRWQNDISSLSTNLTSHTGNTTVHVTAAERTAWNKNTTDISQLSGEIDDQKTQLNALRESIPSGTDAPVKSVNGKTGAVVLSADDVGATTEAWVHAQIDILKAQGVQQVPLFANSIADCTDKTKFYVLPDGFIYACIKETITTEGETVPNFTNLLNDSRTIIKTGKRFSTSSVAWKDVSGGTSYIVPIPKGSVTLRVRNYEHAGYEAVYGFADENTYKETLSSAGMGTSTGEKAVTFTNSNSNYAVFCSKPEAVEIITVNEEITYTTTQGGTQTIETWKNTGHAFVPADYESIINEIQRELAELETEVTTLRKALEDVQAYSVGEVFAPSPQLPANSASESDINADSCSSQDIYDYIDAVMAEYPNYIAKETLGKDQSGTYDVNRYILSKHYYKAWQRTNYPKMYAWTNGSTTIYSVSVSPRIGDTLYTTAYIGTAKGTVTAVNNANDSRTVGGVVYTRDKSKDIEPTLVYTTIVDEDAYNNNNTDEDGGHKVYNDSLGETTTISSATATTITGANGITYTRYPMGDRNSEFEQFVVMTIGSNEHGPALDPRDGAIICARLIKDLAECRNADNLFLNHIKNNVMLIIVPVINPYGFTLGTSSPHGDGYYNYNGVNINRNYDCAGFGVDTAGNHPAGEYGGSEIETQYFMNTISEPNSDVAISVHILGVNNDNMCHYQGNGFDESKIKKIAEVMKMNYNLNFTSYGTAPLTTTAKSPTYITKAGAKGGIIEFQNRIGGSGTRHTPRALEACYTLLLESMHMWLTDLS